MYFARGFSLAGDAVVTDGGETTFKADFDFLDGDYLPDADVKLKIGNPYNTGSGTSWCVALNLTSTRDYAAVDYGMDVSYITSFGDNTESVATAELVRFDAGSLVVTTGSVDVALVDKDLHDFGHYLDRHFDARNFNASLEFEAKKVDGEYSLDIADFKILGGSSFDYLHNHRFAVMFDPHFMFSTEGEIGIMDEASLTISVDVSIPSSFDGDFKAVTAFDADYCTIHNYDDEPRRVCHVGYSDDESEVDLELYLALDRDNNYLKGNLTASLAETNTTLGFVSDFVNHDGDGFEFSLDVEQLEIYSDDFHYLHHHTVEASMEHSWKEGFTFMTAGDIQVDGDMVIDAAFETGLVKGYFGDDRYNRKFYALAINDQEEVAGLNLTYAETVDWSSDSKCNLIEFQVDGDWDGDTAQAIMEIRYVDQFDIEANKWAYTLENTGGIVVNELDKDNLDFMTVSISSDVVGPGGWMTAYVRER